MRNTLLAGFAVALMVGASTSPAAQFCRLETNARGERVTSCYGRVSQETQMRAQNRLSKLGYYRGPIDGVMGEGTRKAISRFQRDSGLRVTGSLTGPTLSALGL